MGSAALGLAMANSPLAPDYEAMLHAPIGGLDLLHWINDGLMAFFFLLVGLEIKREMVEGQLDTWPRRALPCIAAFGGMLVPALIFMAVNLHHPENWRGWAIPTATDIAFALGVLALLGSRVPASLKVFLTSLAIIDDLGAILIIAIFYTSDLSFAALAVAAVFAAALYWLNRRGVTRLLPYVLLGVMLWVACCYPASTRRLPAWSLALTIPIDHASDGEHSPLHSLERRCRPGSPSSSCRSSASPMPACRSPRLGICRCCRRSALGIAAGLFLGKQIGVFAAVFRHAGEGRGASGRRRLAADLRRRAALRHRLHHESFHRLARLC